MSLRSLRWTCGGAMVFLLLAGCAQEATVVEAPQSKADPHAGHVHPTEGPHAGELIELGNDDYHAELVHDSKNVTIYVLNGAANKNVPISASEIVVNLIQNGSPRQFRLQANPESTDPPGNASRFVSKEAGLATRLHDDDAQPRLVVPIDGKSYQGTIPHHHDHAGHVH